MLCFSARFTPMQYSGPWLAMRRVHVSSALVDRWRDGHHVETTSSIVDGHSEAPPSCTKIEPTLSTCCGNEHLRDGLRTLCRFNTQPLGHISWVSSIVEGSTGMFPLPSKRDSREHSCESDPYLKKSVCVTHRMFCFVHRRAASMKECTKDRTHRREKSQEIRCACVIDITVFRRRMS